MKIRNIAFFGVMASILGTVGGAYADDDTTKIIASQSYVDNTKVSSTDLTGKNGILDSTLSDTIKAKSATISSIQDATQASTGLVWTNEQKVDTKIPTVKAVSEQIAKATSDLTAGAYTDNALTTDATSDENKAKFAKLEALQKTAVYVNADTGKRNDHSEDVTAAQIQGNASVLTANEDVAADMDSYFPTAAAVESRVKGAIVTNSNNAATIDSTSDTTAPSAKAVSAALATKENTSNKLTKQTGTWTSSDDNSFPTVAAIDNQTINTNVILATDTDKLTKVAAVQNAIAYAGTVDDQKFASGSLMDTENEMAQDPTTNLVTTKHRTIDSHEIRPNTKIFKDNAAIQSDMDSFIPSVAAVESRVLGTHQALQSSINTKQDALTTDQLAAVNSGITEAKVTSYDAYATGKADKATNLDASTKNSVVQYNAQGIVVSGTAAGALATLDTTALKEINSGSETATCSALSPCILTYTGTNYKWTNLDTNNLSAVADGA